MRKLKPEILSRDGQKQFAVLRWEDFQQIQEELEDLADIRALDAARAKEGGMPGISLSEVKRRLNRKFSRKPKKTQSR